MFNDKFTHKKIGWENSNLGKRKKTLPRMEIFREWLMSEIM